MSQISIFRCVSLPGSPEGMRWYNPAGDYQYPEGWVVERMGLFPDLPLCSMLLFDRLNEAKRFFRIAYRRPNAADCDVWRISCLGGRTFPSFGGQGLGTEEAALAWLLADPHYQQRG